MRFNTKKCYVLSINKSSRYYQLEKHTLQEEQDNPYLGLQISNDLKWSIHINNVCLYEFSIIFGTAPKAWYLLFYFLILLLEQPYKSKSIISMTYIIECLVVFRTCTVNIDLVIYIIRSVIGEHDIYVI